MDFIVKYGRDILLSENMRKEQGFRHHGRKSCFCHSVCVAYESVKIAEKFCKTADMRSLVRGALLHDYYLYDWHVSDKSHKWHGFKHAKTALRNAERDFDLNDREKDIIRKHMFPLNIALPKYKETWIVCLADKICAVRDIFSRKNDCGR